MPAWSKLWPRGAALSLALLAATAGGAVAAIDDAPAFDPVTKVDGETLQVVFGQRAVFHIDKAGRPKIDLLEKGKLAAAHRTGLVRETFAPPSDGRLAAALDASAERRVSVLKLWNGLDHPVEYRLATLGLREGKLEVQPTPGCVLAPGQVYSRSWPRPVLAVALARFVEPAADAEVAPCATEAPR